MQSCFCVIVFPHITTNHRSFRVPFPIEHAVNWNFFGIHVSIPPLFNLLKMVGFRFSIGHEIKSQWQMNINNFFLSPPSSSSTMTITKVMGSPEIRREDGLNRGSEFLLRCRPHASDVHQIIVLLIFDENTCTVEFLASWLCIVTTPIMGFYFWFFLS